MWSMMACTRCHFLKPFGSEAFFSVGVHEETRMFADAYSTGSTQAYL